MGLNDGPNIATIIWGIIEALTAVGLNDWVKISAIVGALAAVGLIIYTAYQVRQNTLISRGQFWLELEKMFTNHDDVHIKLRPGGQWSMPESGGPEDVEDWAKVEDYMGLFEHCEIMMSKKLIDRQTFNSIFSYRLNNILRNQKIVEAKLIREKEKWKVFHSLIKKLKLKSPHGGG